MKKILINSIIVSAVGIILIILVFFTDGLENLISLIFKINYLWLMAAIGCYLLYWLTGSVTLGIIKKAMLDKKDPGHNFKILMVGQFFNSITPFASGGQPAQVYMMNKMGVDGGTGSSIVIIKSVLYTTTLFIYNVVLLILKRDFLVENIPHFMFLFILAAIANGALISLYILVLFKSGAAEKVVNFLFKIIVKLKIKKDTNHARDKIKKSLESFKSGIKLFRAKVKFVFAAYLFQAIQLFFLFSVPVLLHKSLEGNFQYTINLFVSTAMVIMITSYIPTPGTTIGAEGFSLLFIAKFFLTSPAFSVVLIWRLITYYSNVIVGGFFCMLIPEKPLSQIGVKNEEI